MEVTVGGVILEIVGADGMTTAKEIGTAMVVIGVVILSRTVVDGIGIVGSLSISTDPDIETQIGDEGIKADHLENHRSQPSTSKHTRHNANVIFARNWKMILDLRAISSPRPRPFVSFGSPVTPAEQHDMPSPSES